jgi:hypothetical protein
VSPNDAFVDCRIASSRVIAPFLILGAAPLDVLPIPWRLWHGALSFAGAV